jgi:hypothetical protein
MMRQDARRRGLDGRLPAVHILHALAQYEIAGFYL